MAKIRTEDNLEETRLISLQHPHEDDEEEDEEEEEETLSLCDLPVNLSAREVDEFRSRGEESPRNGESHEPTESGQEDSDFKFDFAVMSSLRVGSDPAEMSTADELFFKGRILPLRHSVSLDSGSTRNPTRLLTRSESVDLRRSSRSSSHNSSSSTITGGSDRKMKNTFMNYSQPSPQPQIRRTSSLTARVSTSRSPKSSIWDFLRLGLVRAPEIELQDLKLRTANGNTKSSVSRNSSCSSTSTSCNSKKTRKQRNGSDLSDRRRGFLFGDCKCSVAAAEAVPLKSGVEAAAEEKQRRKKKKAERSAMSRKRTFEWLKELSHATLLDHGRSLA